MDLIKIRGARQHNLKNIDLDLPRNQLIIVTGLSGSGKSTLAFDTLYAEGQRRYVESLSTYARQFLERMQKPDADLIEGLSPAIAIEQRTTGHNPRSTVGTVTEIYDYLRLLFARIGIPFCHKCHEPIRSHSIDEIVQELITCPKGTKISILSPLVHAQKGNHASLITRLKRDGFARVRINQTIYDLDMLKPLAKNEKHTIEVVVDRLTIREDTRNRLTDSLELAMAVSGGSVQVGIQGEDNAQSDTYWRFNERAACPTCGLTYPDITPASFSFNSPQGACGSCDGLGTQPVFDPSRIIADATLSLKDGAVSIWANRQSAYYQELLAVLAHDYQADINTPFKDLPEELKNALLHGTGDISVKFSVGGTTGQHSYNKPFEGLIPNLQRRYRETESETARQEISRYMSFRTCAVCNGARLNQESLSVKIKDRGIHQVACLPVSQAIGFFRTLHLENGHAQIAHRIVSEIIERLEFLNDVGLNYLSLDRAAHTLSGGESQRIRLATQIGAKLTGILYVLDEPSIGLHPKDNRRLLQTLFRIRDMGNTVVVVEHDRETISAADYVVDMGPGAGVQGGRVIYAGSSQGLAASDQSLTGQYISGRRTIPVPKKRRVGNKGQIIIHGAAIHNLKAITVPFPLGCISCVTGVSGSGKSTLVIDTLFRALTSHLQHQKIPADVCSNISGLPLIDKAINFDQSSIGRTPRSNPATYTGVFTFIRELFSKTPDARIRGFKPGRFSYNAKGGRCEACAGEGIIKIEMHFLPDIYVPCDICHGHRYNRETMEVRYKGKNIAEVLSMTVLEALTFFKNIESIREKLNLLIEVGLGYIQLGQPATTLSGGEAQRVKLSKELSRRATGKTLYILDEPTTGLHMEDVNKLLQVLTRLVDSGNTVVIIEHNLDVIKSADHIIDLGPEGGDGGGYIIATGTPEDVASMGNSYTGHYLKEVLNTDTTQSKK